MYIKLNNGVPEQYSIWQLRKDNPNVSFPKDPPVELLEGWNVYPYTVADKPTYNHDTQYILNDTWRQVNNSWIKDWTIHDHAPEELSERIRERRNVLLQESDWVVTKAVEQNAADSLGIQVPVVWLDYRQALRDIPQQTGFPDSVTWPQKP